jgi:hypothetical protein
LVLLQGQARYGVHANAVDGEHGGVLIVGKPGQGKSTLTACLVDQGWRYVADDAIVLRRRDDGRVDALAVRRSFSCAPKTLDWLPRLQTSVAPDALQVDGKLLLDLEAAYPGQSRLGCQPGLVVFPKVGVASRSELIPMAPESAMVELLGQMAGARGDRTVLAAQLAVARDLVDQASCFQFIAGTDVLTDGQAVSMLVAEALYNDFNARV